jgi:hypothetical protein
MGPAIAAATTSHGRIGTAQDQNKSVGITTTRMPSEYHYNLLNATGEPTFDQQRLTPPPDDKHNIYTSSSEAGLLSFDSTSSAYEHPVCRHVLPHPIPTAMAIWSANLGAIHKASQLILPMDDPENVVHDFYGPVAAFNIPSITSGD